MNLDQFHNVEIENELLSIVINDHNVADEVLSSTSDLFYSSQNKMLYEAIKCLWTDDKKITINTIYALLKTDIQKIGGFSRLSDIYNSYITSVTYKQLLKALEEYRTRRKLRDIQNSIGTYLAANKSNEAILTSITEATDNINNLVADDDGDIEETMEALAYNLEQRCTNPGRIEGLETGLIDLDRRIKGLKKQELIIIAARPGQGKTTEADNIAVNLAAKEKHVVMFNLEMSKEQILEKMLSNIALVENEKQQLGLLNDKDWERIGRGQDKLLQLSKYLKIYDKVMNIDKMVSLVKTLKKKNKIDLLIVDYLQLIECISKGNREQEISYISRTLKKISKDLDIPVIALSQLSRAPEMRADHRPILSDLRESGSIEQDADKVIFLYRDEYYNKETEEKNIVENIIAKNRTGSTGTVKLCWLPQYQRVTNLDLRNY